MGTADLPFKQPPQHELALVAACITLNRTTTAIMDEISEADTIEESMKCFEDFIFWCSAFRRSHDSKLSSKGISELHYELQACLRLVRKHLSHRLMRR